MIKNNKDRSSRYSLHGRFHQKDLEEAHPNIWKVPVRDFLLYTVYPRRSFQQKKKEKRIKKKIKGIREKENGKILIDVLQRDESSDPWHYFVLFFALDCLTQLLFSLLPSSSLYFYVLLFSRAKSLQRQDNIAIKRLKNQWLCSSLCHRRQKKEGKKEKIEYVSQEKMDHYFAKTKTPY